MIERVNVHVYNILRRMCVLRLAFSPACINRADGNSNPEVLITDKRQQKQRILSVSQFSKRIKQAKLKPTFQCTGMTCCFFFAVARGIRYLFDKSFHQALILFPIQVACCFVASMHTSSHFVKPFNPTLGETLQAGFQGGSKVCTTYHSDSFSAICQCLNPASC